jgi:signal transduction histidine kinase
MGEADRLRGIGVAEQADGIEETVRAMRHTVDRELARARRAARAVDAQADPARVANGLIAVLRRTPEGERLQWQQTIPEGLAVALDEADLAEAMGALAENAACHARGKVVMSARVQGDRLQLTVADDGLGIAQEDCDRLMRRHARADEAGTGLGLAIASDIAEAAGGMLTLGDAAPGLAASLFLPLARRNQSSPMDRHN